MKLMKKQKQQEEEDQAQVMNNETLYLEEKKYKGINCSIWNRCIKYRSSRNNFKC